MPKYIHLDTSDITVKRRLDALRARAKRAGYRIEKARGQTHSNNLGGLQLIDTCTNLVIDGVDFDLTIEGADCLLSAQIIKKAA